MVRVHRTFMFASVLFLLETCAMGQVPPGMPFDPAKNPNPIETFLRNQDFKPSTYAEARKVVGFDPLGLSGKEGKAVSVEVGTPAQATQKIALPSDEFPTIKVDFSPVFRQVYILTSGEMLTLDAFKFPKVPIPLNELTDVLNSAAFRPGSKTWKARFGPTNPPERLMVRDTAALLFDDNHEFVLFWREGEDCYVIKTTAARKDLFRLVDDLL
jgi:hypothetical protein